MCCHNGLRWLQQPSVGSDLHLLRGQLRHVHKCSEYIPPNHWHALCGVWAMQAGKDAYIEKPICHNVMEGSALVAAAKKYE